MIWLTVAVVSEAFESLFISFYGPSVTVQMLEPILLAMDDTAEVAMALKQISATRQQHEHGGKLPLENYSSGVSLWEEYFRSAIATMAHVRATGRWRTFVAEIQALMSAAPDAEKNEVGAGEGKAAPLAAPLTPTGIR